MWKRVRTKETHQKKNLYLFNYLPKHSIGFQYFFILNTNRYMHTSFSLFFKISDHTINILDTDGQWEHSNYPFPTLCYVMVSLKTKPVDTCAALCDGRYVTVVSETVGQRSRGSLLKLQLKWQDVKNYNDDDVDCGGNVWYPSWMHLYLIDFEL